MMSGQLSIRFVGGAFFRSSDDDDGGYQGKGASMQLGLLLRFRTGTTRIGVAVRLLNLDVLWLETRSGVWRPGPGGGAERRGRGRLRRRDGRGERDRFARRRG